jgi:hypothetical protein
MSVEYIKEAKSEIKVVLACDSAIGAEADYSKYLDTLDEGHLCLSKEPTRVVVRLRLPYRLSEKVKKAQMYLKDGDVQFNAGYYMEEVRASISGVENATDAVNGLEFKRDGDGGAHVEFVEIIEELGETLNLFRARQVAMANKADLLKKK